MAVSAITITNPVAVSGLIGFISISWSYTTPPGQGCLGYMIPDAYEVFVGTTNVFGSATKVATVDVPFYSHPVTGSSQTRFVWVRAVDVYGNTGIETAFGSATTAAAPASASDVAAIQVDYNAKITAESSARIAADGATATSLNGVSVTATDAQTKANLGTASGLIGFQATAAPTGFTAAFQLMAKVASAGVLRVAGIAADVTSSLARLRLIADEIVVQDSGGTIFPLFDTAGKVLTARIGKIIAGMLDVGTINASNIFVDNVVITSKVGARGVLGSSQITDVDVRSSGDVALSSTFNANIASHVVSVSGGPIVMIEFSCTQSRPGSDASNNGNYTIAIYRDGLGPIAARTYFYDDNFVPGTIFVKEIDAPGDGSHTYTVKATVTSGLGILSLQGLKTEISQFKR